MTANSNSTVIVTGGTKGLGLALSFEFARHGYRVLALYHEDAQAASKLDEAMAAEGLAGRSFRHDVTANGDDSGVWSQPEITEAGALVLIHNASAAFEPKPLHLLAWEEFTDGIDVALKGGWLSALGLLRPMLERRDGTIVSILTSALGDEPPKGFTAYLAAKAALRALTQSLAAEYGARGIRVMSVSPGFMQTSLTDRWHETLRQAVMQGSAPADPARVAGAIREIVENRALPSRGENYGV